MPNYPPGRSIQNVQDLLAVGTPTGKKTYQLADGSIVDASVPQAVVALTSPQISAIIEGLLQRGPMYIIPFRVALVPQLLLQSSLNRFYVLIINQDAANRMFVGFDNQVTAQTGIPLAINLGAWEPTRIPTNDIYVIGTNAAGNVGTCVYGLLPSNP